MVHWPLLNNCIWLFLQISANIVISHKHKVLSPFFFFLLAIQDPPGAKPNQSLNKWHKAPVLFGEALMGQRMGCCLQQIRCIFCRTQGHPSRIGKDRVAVPGAELARQRGRAGQLRKLRCLQARTWQLLLSHSSGILCPSHSSFALRKKKEAFQNSGQNHTHL